ncbi:MAG TPA: hypothetical protein VFZ78_01790 [Flavisolibacter sp.]
MKRKEEQANPNTGRHEHPLPHEIAKEQKQQTGFAHEEAMKDIEEDADLGIHSPNDDLDEGESARLGENNTGLI